MSLVSRAATMARIAHAGQVDKAGEPYIGHPARVAKRVAAAGFAPEVVAAAWLHDVVEDTPVTVAQIETEFGPEVARVVAALTKTKGQTRAAYLAQVKAAGPSAVAVKWADVIDNSRPERLAALAPAVKERLEVKYAETRAALDDANAY